MENINYLELKKLLPSKYRHYVFIDDRKYSAGSLFAANNLKIKVKETWDREEIKYQFVICDVMKKDVPLFERVMQKLKDKMLLIGNTDYENCCEAMFKEILED